MKLAPNRQPHSCIRTFSLSSQRFASAGTEGKEIETLLSRGSRAWRTTALKSSAEPMRIVGIAWSLIFALDKAGFYTRTGRLKTYNLLIQKGIC